MNDLDISQVRVSIVDDNPFDLKATETVLRHAGFQVASIFESGEALIEAFLDNHQHQLPCTLFLLDFNLPGINGIELCREIKSHSHLEDLPVIMITGEANVEDLQLAYEAGVVDFIRKPFNRIELVSRLTLAAKNWYLQKELQRLAHYDPLTGLVNRTLFIDRLDRAISMAERQKSRMALMFVDLDNFKPLNDTLGHKLGDIALQLAAKKLQSAVRDSDTVARFGGDEFIILLPNISDTHSLDRILAEIAEEFSQPLELFVSEAGRLEWPLGASVGTAVYPDDADTCQDLVKLADSAMYRHKQAKKAAR